MITKFKLFESIADRPQVGDWILIEFDDGTNDWLKGYKKIKEFVSRNFAYIVNADFSKSVASLLQAEYKVRFSDLSEKDRKILNNYMKQEGYDRTDDPNIIDLMEWDIKFWSKTKEDLEIKINAHKYNI